MTPAPVPRLSVVVLCDEWATVADVAEALARQPEAGAVELVLVGPDAAPLAPPPGAAASLGDVRTVESPLVPMGLARARGTRAASAAAVVLGETHAYPGDGWASALLGAVEGGAAAAAPRFVSANPDGALSWAALAMDYGRWTGDHGGPLDVAPSYNAAWARETLLAEGGDRLPELLSPGRELSDRLRAAGHVLLHVPEATVAHVNASRRRAWLRERWLGGRLVGCARGRGWPWPRRVAYALACPLIAAVLARRALRTATPRPRGAVPALFVAAAVWAAGEAAGYVLGCGEAESAMSELELHKVRYVRGAR